MSNSGLVIKKVKRIMTYTSRPHYVRVVVGYRYWNGYGDEIDLLGHVLEENEHLKFPKDGFWLTLKWIWSGCH